MPSSTAIAVRELGSACVLTPPKDFAAAAGTALAQAVDTALVSAPDVLIVDFSRVENVNSAGVGSLFDAARRARDRGVPIALAALQGQPRLVIERVRLPLYVPVHATVEEAVASYRED